MTKHSNIKAIATAACVCLAVSAPAVAAVAQNQSGRYAPTPAGEQLRATLLQMGELADFASRDCPAADAHAGHRYPSDGFLLGMRQALRSRSLDATGHDSAAMYSSPRAAQAAAAQVAARIRAQHDAVSMPSAIDGSHAYRVATRSGVEYAVVFAAGREEHSIDVELPPAASGMVASELVRAAQLADARA